MLTCQAHLKVSRLPYLFKNGVKPNFNCQHPGNFKAKALGFTRSLIDAVYLETVVFFYDFHGFSDICSTQPTGLKTPKLTPMVRLGNRTYRAWGKTSSKKGELNIPDKVTQTVATSRL